MGNILAYSGLVTKVRAMQKQLLKSKDFEELASCQSVQAAVEFIRGLPAYKGEKIPLVNTDDIHRGNVEKLLEVSLYDDYSRLYKFGNLQQKRFLKLYLKGYEVDLINYCLRIVFNQYDEPFDLSLKRPFFDHYSQISIEKLITSSNAKELIDSLQGTEYYRPLAHLKDLDHVTLFDYDLALEQYHFLNVWKERKKVLKNEELAQYTKDCGYQIDLLNLQWIYRAKKYYNMLPPDIYALMIPVQYRLRMDIVKELVEAPSLNELGSVVKKTPYARYLDRSQNLSNGQMYENCMRKLHLADRRSNPYSIATVNTYLYLKEQEINKLTTALECIRYGISTGETLGYLGGVTQ